MIVFSKEKVLLLHQLISQQTGGAVGVRDADLLESALNNAYIDGKELYKTKEEKAASLGFSLISNHSFVDGNKRIGMYVMLTFLEVNGVKINASNEEVVKIGLGIASGKIKYDDLLEWIKKHKEY